MLAVPLGTTLWIYTVLSTPSGSNGDSGIFKNSSLGEAFTGQLLDIPGPKRLPGYPEGGALPHCIVADEAFPLRMDLM